MDKLNLLLFMMPHHILIDPLASLAIILGLLAMFMGYLYRLTPPFVVRHAREASKAKHFPRS
jgi:hypothetical protein